MSNIALTPNASGTGTFTIASPNSNTNRTLTLPDATGTVNISGLANEVPAGSAGAPAIYSTGDTNTGIFFPAADTIAFAEGGTEAARFDSSGNFGLGTTTPSYTSAGRGNLTIGGSGGAILGFQVGGVAKGYVFHDNTNLQLWNEAAGPILLGTSGTERMNIGSTGAVTIANLAGAGSRTVTANASGVLAAASDSRLKHEVTDAPIPGLAEVMQLEPRAYQWIDDIENRGENAAVEIGFFANEVKDIIPSAAPMGNDGYYGFYDRAVIAALTKGMQEQQATITALTARITALEAAQ